MTIYSGFSHWKWWFSIVMLVYQRVFLTMDDLQGLFSLVGWYTENITVKKWIIFQQWRTPPERSPCDWAKQLAVVLGVVLWCLAKSSSNYRRWCDDNIGICSIFGTWRGTSSAPGIEERGAPSSIFLFLFLQQHIWNTSLLTIKLKHFNNFCVFRSLALALVVPS